MFKHIAEREAKESQDMQKKQTLEAKTKTEAGQVLRLQMREKQAQKDLTKQNDVIYANEMQSRVTDIEVKEKEAVNKKLRAKVDYSTSLTQQMKIEK